MFSNLMIVLSFIGLWVFIRRGDRYFLIFRRVRRIVIEDLFFSMCRIIFIRWLIVIDDFVSIYIR